MSEAAPRVAARQPEAARAAEHRPPERGPAVASRVRVQVEQGRALRVPAGRVRAGQAPRVKTAEAAAEHPLCPSATTKAW
jgi:hypothetical protein